jgi:hypothetical protein
MGVVWASLTFLLQSLSEPETLGRVLVVDYTLTRPHYFEAASATLSGDLADAGLSNKQLALVD